LHEDEASLLREGGWATYVVDLAGRLLVAPRRTEHVACASGEPVLAAGEIRFAADGEVVEVSNNSTGYCPAEDCWASVRAALENAEIRHPAEFTFAARFRRCPRCGERNLVKDDWYSCALCEAELPSVWNF
jgi:DNA-directed RNA polymerase subunit RPC12/RpoP